MAGAPLASIILPLRNGGPTSLETVQAVLQQRVSGGFEVIVIDSESSDGSPESIERLFQDAEANPQEIPLRMIHIPVREFGHGKTRNLGASMSASEFVVFLSQDATPMGTTWLKAMLSPFSQPEVSGVFCRQVARPWASLPEQFILETAYPLQSSHRTRASLRRRDAGFILFSNAASAIRRSALDRHPFAENIMMCEDARWAVDALEAGLSIAYTADARVLHSHGYSLKVALSRTFDYAVSLEGLPGGMTLGGYATYLWGATSFVARRGGVMQLPRLAAFEAARCIGYSLGSRYRRLPLSVCRRVSGYPRWFSSGDRVTLADGRGAT